MREMDWKDWNILFLKSWARIDYIRLSFFLEEKISNAFEDDFVSMQRDWNKTTKQQFQILSCLVADAVTTGFHTDAENKDIWLWSQ